MAFLDEMTETSDVDVVWITIQGDLALAVSVEPHIEAILVEGFGQRLPGARIVPESPANVTAYTTDLDYARALTGPVPETPIFPHLLLNLAGGPASVRLTWRDGVLGCTVFADSEIDVETLQAQWDGCRAWPQWAQGLVGLFDRAEIPPSRMMVLPPARDFTMLASRKMEERAFSHDWSAGGLLLGSDVDGRPVRLPTPGARLAWIGAPQRVDNVFGGMAQRWPGRVVVFDADAGHVDKAWQDVSDAVLIDWRTPGRSSHVNPLMRLPGEAVDRYVDRIATWFKRLGITPKVLGARTWKGLLALLRFAATGQEEVVPPAILRMLQSSDIEANLDALRDARDVLPQSDRTALETVDWSRARQSLAPAREILAQVFDVPEMVLWFPEYLDAERLREARWVIVRVPRRRKSQRRYWNTMMPLLTALYGDDAETLVLALNAGTTGGKILDWEGDTSVIAWGASIEAATGKAMLPSDLDVLVGARANPGRFAPLLGVSRAALAAQNVYQAEARLGGDVGSVRLQMPRAKERDEAAQSAWRADGVSIPAPTTVLGETEGAGRAIAALLRASLTPDERVMVIGKRDLWSALRATFDGSFTYLPADNLPMLNPLDSSSVYGWVWWGKGLGIPADVFQRAYREGVDTVQSLLRYARSDANDDLAESSTVAVLQDVCSTGLFGVAESAPATWLDEVPRMAVEAVNPALTRALVMGGLEAGARIVLYDAPGIGRRDLPALRRGQALVYPGEAWIDTVLVTPGSNGLVRGLPREVQEAVDALGTDEGYLYQRDVNRGRRVRLG
jgi:hypothetical protein